MSADNWDVCPRCHAADVGAQRVLMAQVTEGYGKMPIEEWDTLREQASRPLDDRERSTFREDYEFYGAETGTITVSYSGSCSVCRLSVSFEEEHPFWPEVKP